MNAYDDAHLRPYFPNLLSHAQLNRRIHAPEPQLMGFQRDLAATLADGSDVYRVIDTTLIRAVVGVGACRKGVFNGQAAFGRSVSKTLGELLTRLAAKLAAYTCGQLLNARLGRPLRLVAQA
jgi:hypothetical protein